MKNQKSLRRNSIEHDLEQRLTRISERLQQADNIINSLKFLTECQRRVIRNYERSYNIYGPDSMDTDSETRGREEYFRLTKGLLFLPGNMN
jgi:hypothetical protein